MSYKKYINTFNIVTVLIMLIIGIILSIGIYKHISNVNKEYATAIQITEKELFQHTIKKDTTKALIYGKLKSVDSVTDSNLKGEYMHIKRIKEEYTCHTRVIYKNLARMYYTWDRVDTIEKHSKEISFLGVNFPYKKILKPDLKYLKTVKIDDKTRYIYYVRKKEYTGTIYTTIKNKTIKDNSQFYNDITIDQTIRGMETVGLFLMFVFWFCWIGAIGIILIIKKEKIS